MNKKGSLEVTVQQEFYNLHSTHLLHHSNPLKITSVLPGTRRLLSLIPMLSQLFNVASKQKAFFFFFFFLFLFFRKLQNFNLSGDPHFAYLWSQIRRKAHVLLHKNEGISFPTYGEIMRALVLHISLYLLGCSRTYSIEQTYEVTLIYMYYLFKLHCTCTCSMYYICTNMTIGSFYMYVK